MAIGVLEKTNLDQIITSKRAKLGPDNNLTAYIYTRVVELKVGPRFGGLCVKTGPSYKLKTGPKLFSLIFPYFYRVLGYVLKHKWCRQFVPKYCVFFLQNCRDVKNDVFEKRIAFFVFVFFMLLKEKQKNKKLNKQKKKKDLKILSKWCFLRWSSKNAKK